ncbi:MAG: hypothetical protein HKN75_01530 [Bacteroidia bacterium]|nr:hypothetical protein [Bacteroidia bacterium]
MKEFMLFIKNEGNPVASLTPEKQQEHIQKVGGFIMKLVEGGNMKSAQPLEPQGSVVSFNCGQAVVEPVDENKEVISGYYHLMAKDLNDAIEIAKSDPRFEDGDWKIEVRPIMKVEGVN